VSEVLDIVDVDELEASAGSHSVGRCPECGTEIPAENVSTGVLTGQVTAECPNGNRDDDVHENDRRGRYKIEELDEL